MENILTNINVIVAIGLSLATLLGTLLTAMKDFRELRKPVNTERLEPDPSNPPGILGVSSSGPPGLDSIRFLTGSVAGNTFQMTKPTITIGREPGNDIVVSDPSVSRHHVQMSLINGTWTISKLAQQNTVTVNQREVQQSPLNDRDTIGLGSILFLFQTNTSVPRTPLPVSYFPTYSQWNNYAVPLARKRPRGVTLLAIVFAVLDTLSLLLVLFLIFIVLFSPSDTRDFLSSFHVSDNVGLTYIALAMFFLIVNVGLLSLLVWGLLELKKTAYVAAAIYLFFLVVTYICGLSTSDSVLVTFFFICFYGSFLIYLLASSKVRTAFFH